MSNHLSRAVECCPVNNSLLTHFASLGTIATWPKGGWHITLANIIVGTNTTNGSMEFYSDYGKWQTAIFHWFSLAQVDRPN